MKKIIVALGVIALCFAGINAAMAANPVPKGFGVNIHFTGAPVKDLDLLQEMGFDMARTDFKWARVEKSIGQYSWTEYDQLINGLIARGITPYLILDYNNPVYGSSEMTGISTKAQIQGYTNFAKAAVERYKGKKIVWEIWNEPNLGIFWNPTPNATQYMNLVKVAVPAMRAADPNAVIVAPGAAYIANTFDYIKECARLGLFDYIDGLSVHPYKNDAPENGSIQYLFSALRDVLRQYGKGDMPILAGEWGFSEAWTNIKNEQTQAEYLARQLVIQDEKNIPVSIIYEFRDSGTNASNVEHNFGILRNDYSKKPAYTSVTTYRKELKGWTYSKKLPSDASDFIYEYVNGTAKKAVAWTTGANKTATIYGNSVNLTRMPTYISEGSAPPPSNDPPTSGCPTTAPVINSVDIALKQSTGDYYAVIVWQDKAETESGYDIYQSINSQDNFKKVNSLNLLDGVREVKVMLNIGKAPTPGMYYYKIVANYNCGSVQTSNIVSVEVKDYRPSAPSDLSGFGSISTGSKYVAVLKWVDTSNNEDGYNIYYAASQTGPFQKAGTVTKDTASVVHWLGTEKGTFYFQVRSYNASGESDSQSTLPVTIY